MKKLIGKIKSELTNGKDPANSRFVIPGILIILTLVILAFTFLRQNFCLSFRGNTAKCIVNFEKGRLNLDVEKVETARMKEKIDALTSCNNSLRKEKKNLIREKAQMSLKLDEAKEKFEDFTKTVVVNLEERETYLCDLDNDGIDEVIGVYYLNLLNKEFDSLGIQVSVFSHSSPEERMKEVCSFMFRDLVGEPVFEDLDNNGKKEMIVSSHVGNSTYGRTIIIYENKGSYEIFDSKSLGNYSLGVTCDKTGRKTYLTAWPCYSNQYFCHAEQIYIPLVYKWNGSTVVKATDEERNKYYQNGILPRLKKELSELPNSTRKKDEDFKKYYKRRIAYLKDTITVVNNIMNGGIKDETAFLEKYRW